MHANAQLAVSTALRDVGDLFDDTGEQVPRGWDQDRWHGVASRSAAIRNSRSRRPPSKAEARARGSCEQGGANATARRERSAADGGGSSAAALAVNLNPTIVGGEPAAGAGGLGRQIAREIQLSEAAAMSTNGIVPVVLLRLLFRLVTREWRSGHRLSRWWVVCWRSRSCRGVIWRVV